MKRPKPKKTLREYMLGFPEEARHAERERIATECGVTPGYLHLVELGHRNASHKLAPKLEAATGGVVVKEKSRPDIWPSSARAQTA